jgi:hypothetical protein
MAVLHEQWANIPPAERAELGDERRKPHDLAEAADRMEALQALKVCAWQCIRGMVPSPEASRRLPTALWRRS